MSASDMRAPSIPDAGPAPERPALPSDGERCAFYEEVLRVFWDNQEDLYWWTRADGAHFGVTCSDFFAWGVADAEEILPAHLPCLAQTRQELREYGVDGQIWWPLLWAARTRRCRPQRAAYKVIPAALHSLFDAAAEPRASGHLGSDTR